MIREFVWSFFKISFGPVHIQIDFLEKFGCNKIFQDKITDMSKINID